MMLGMDASFSITTGLFSAYLKCATKAYLITIGEEAPTCFFASTEARISTNYKSTAIPALSSKTPRIAPIDFTQVGRDLPVNGDTYYVDCDTVVYRCGQPTSEHIEHRAKTKLLALVRFTTQNYTLVA